MSQQIINDEIRSKSVRLVSDQGESMGVYLTSKALEIAEHQGLDLVMVSPKENPPVCKLMDCGKINYKKSKKKKSRASKVVKKHVRIKPNIEDHDMERKIRDIQKFLDKGYNVSVQVVLKGRQNQHDKLAMDKTIGRLKEELDESFFVSVTAQHGSFRAELHPGGQKTP